MSIELRQQQCTCLVWIKILGQVNVKKTVRFTKVNTGGAPSGFIILTSKLHKIEHCLDMYHSIQFLTIPGFGWCLSSTKTVD